jgi:hypothetical protein
MLIEQIHVVYDILRGFVGRPHDDDGSSCVLRPLPLLEVLLAASYGLELVEGPLDCVGTVVVLGEIGDQVLELGVGSLAIAAHFWHVGVQPLSPEIGLKFIVRLNLCHIFVGDLVYLLDFGGGSIAIKKVNERQTGF